MKMLKRHDSGRAFPIGSKVKLQSGQLGIIKPKAHNARKDPSLVCVKPINGGRATLIKKAKLRKA